MSYQDKLAAELEKIELEYRTKTAAALVKAEIMCALVEMGLPEPQTICVHNSHASATIKVPKVDGEYRHYTGAGPVESAILLCKLTSESLVKMDPARSARSNCLSLYPAEARVGREEFVSDGVQYAVKLRQHLFGEQGGTYVPTYTNLELSWWVKAGGRLVEITIPVCGVPHNLVVTKINNRSPHGYDKPTIPGSRQFSFGGAPGADVNYMFAEVEDALDGLSPMSTAKEPS